MSEWTEQVAANNWCDQFVRNGGCISRASQGYMVNGAISFIWETTPEGQTVWNDRYESLLNNPSTLVR